MNKRNLNYFQKRLKAELEDLLRGADCNFDSLNDSEEHLPDPIDRASSLTDRSLAQNICDRENLRLKKIEQALEDIAIGAYGTCERCGENIAIKRLQANPLARHCLRCKTEIETRERLTGAP